MAYQILSDLQNNIVIHDLINTYFGSTIPHEFYFLKVFSKYELLNDHRLTLLFIRFVTQYYPKYHWDQMNVADCITSLLYECCLYSRILEYKYLYDIEEDESLLTKSMEFGDIITDFLIRFRNYSLVKCSGESIIITAQSDCHKRFEQYLSNGYSLERKAKVTYVGNFHSINRGHFYKLPVLPTRDIGYPIDEIIETSEEKYMKVLSI